MKTQLYVIDPVVFVRPGVQPVDGIFDSIVGAVSKVGSGLVKIGSTVASKLGTVIKSPVLSKVLEGGVAIGGSILLGKQAAAQQKAQLQAAQAQANAARAQAVAAPVAQPSGAPVNTMLLYGGAAALALLGVYLLSRRR